MCLGGIVARTGRSRTTHLPPARPTSDKPGRGITGTTRLVQVQYGCAPTVGVGVGRVGGAHGPLVQHSDEGRVGEHRVSAAQLLTDCARTASTSRAKLSQCRRLQKSCGSSAVE